MRIRRLLIAALLTALLTTEFAVTPAIADPGLSGSGQLPRSPEPISDDALNESGGVQIPPIEVHGVVLDRATSNPISGITLRFIARDGGSMTELTSTDGGMFSSSEIGIGAYDVLLRDGSGAYALESIADVVVGDGTPLYFEMSRVEDMESLVSESTGEVPPVQENLDSNSPPTQEGPFSSPEPSSVEPSISPMSVLAQEVPVIAELSGLVTKDEDGTQVGVSGINVRIFPLESSIDSEPQYVTTTASGDAIGSYTISNLESNQSYRVCFEDPLHLLATTCLMWSSGSDLNVTLQEGQTISGTVMGEGETTPTALSGIKIFATPSTSGTTVWAESGNDGAFALRGLDPSVEYLIQFRDPDGVWATEFYNDSFVSSGSTLVKPVEFFDGESPRTLDALLVAAETISGKVTGASKPLPSIRVELRLVDTAGESTSYIDVGAVVESAADGTYEVKGLAPRQKYQVKFSDPSGIWAMEYFDGELDEANAAQVLVGSSDIDATLTLNPNVITGRVTGAGGGLEGIEVSVYERSEGPSVYYRYVTTVLSDSTGKYIFANLIKDSEYRLRFVDPDGDWVEEFYNSKNGLYAATSVVAPAAFIDAELDGAVSISGVVTGVDAGSGDEIPLSGIQVWADPSQSSYSSSALTGVDGSYEIKGLRPGDKYRIRFEDPRFTDMDPATVGEWAPESFDNVIQSSKSTLVTAPQEAINATLVRAASISGTVTGEGLAPGNTTLEGIAVYADSPEYAGTMTLTGADGGYKLEGLIPGVKYQIRFEDPRFSDGDPATVGEWSPEYFNNTFSASQATFVSAPTSSVNAILARAVSISGTVTGEGRALGNEALEGIGVLAESSGYESVAWAFTGPDGSYKLEGLIAGPGYRIRFYDPRFSDGDPATVGEWAPEYFDDSFTAVLADPVTGNRLDVDAKLSPAVSIVGTVRGAETEGTDPSGLAGIEVIAWESESRIIASRATTGEGGTYSLDGLQPGQGYTVQFSDPRFTDNLDETVGIWAAEYFEDAYEFNEADLVKAPATVNALLGAAPSISGTVTGIESEGVGLIGLPGIQVSAIPETYGRSVSAYTASNGKYVLQGLQPGKKYRISFSDPRFTDLDPGTQGVWASEYFDDVLTYSDAELISGPADDIDATLSIAASIAGKVTGTPYGAADQVNLGGIEVIAYPKFGGIAAQTETLQDGTYQLEGLSPGQQYRLEFVDPNGNWLSKYFGSESEPDWGDYVDSGSTAINITLDPAVSISGKVTQASGVGIANVEVRIWSPTGLELWTSTDSQGQYEIRGLRSGVGYFVRFSSSENWITKWFDDKQSPLDGPGSAVAPASDINAILSPGETISGTVTGRPKNGSPQSLEGIAVTAYQGGMVLKETASLSDGTFVLNGLIEGIEVEIYFQDFGRNWVSSWLGGRSQVDATSVSVPSDNLSIELQPTVVISGVVQSDGDSPLPLSGILVSANAEIGGGAIDYDLSLTDNLGRFEVSFAEGDEVLLQFFDPKGNWLREYYEDAEYPDQAKLVTAPASNLVVSMELAVSISGRVLDDSGLPIRGLTVEAVDLLELSEASYLLPKSAAYTNSRGEYTLKGLKSDSEYRVRFSGSGNKWASEYYETSVDIENAYVYNAATAVVAPNSDIDGVLSEDVTISGRAVDEEGNPISLLFIHLQPIDGESWDELLGSTDSDGYFAFDDLGDGTNHIVFVEGGELYFNQFYDGSSTIETAKEVTAPDSTVVIEMVTISQVSGVVKDIAERPIQGVKVSAIPQKEGAGEPLVAYTDEEGKFLFTNLAKGDKFKLEFDDPDGNWVAEFFDDVQEERTATEVTAPRTDIAVTLVSTSNAPIITNVAPGYRSLNVTFVLPGGGSPTNIEYSIDGGRWKARRTPGIASPISIPFLRNGVQVSVRLRSVGPSGPSNASSPAVGTPSALPPGAPSIREITAGLWSLRVFFNSPSTTGGSPLTNYEYSIDGGSWTPRIPAGILDPIDISGLMTGRSYSIRIRARNAIGAGEPSAAVISSPNGVPGVPIITSITPLDRALSVQFQAPESDGGSAVLFYEYSLSGRSWRTLSPATFESPLIIRRLRGGREFSIRIRAVNSAGPGPSSEAVTGTPLRPR